MKKQGKGWNFIMKILGDRSIRKQLYGVYSVAMVLPILLLGSFLISNTYRLLSDYHTDLMNSDNSRVKNLMFEFTTQVRNLSENVVFDIPVQEVLVGNFESTEDYRRKVNRVAVLDNYKSTYVEISDILIYSDNPEVIDYKQFHSLTEEVSNSDWYQKALEQSGVFWTGITEAKTSGILSSSLCLVRKIPLVDSPYSAVLVMKISDDYLRSSIENSSFETYISVGEQEAFYSSNRSLTGTVMPMDIDYSLSYYQNVDRIAVDGKVCFAEVSTLNTYQSESKIYICTINKAGYYEIWHILLICFVILGLSIVLPGILIFFFTHYLTGRIDILRQEMHKASRQDYELIPVLHGQDEISEAYEDLQIMVENIKEHEAKAYEAKIKEKEIQSKQREMEFKMLSSQINPHFLYNTLETIRMKAFTAGDREVADAIKLLGKSMRYVLENTGTSETTLSKELEHVEVYLKIQQLRFGDRFDFTLDIQDGIETETIYMLPLLLQPLVENAMVHGMENLESDGHVKISVYQGDCAREWNEAVIISDQEDTSVQISDSDDNIYIEIWDNGGGIEEESLQSLRKAVETKDISRSKSIGLYNINQRLKLSYGEQNSLQIDSALGIGTRILLTLPSIRCRH